MGLIEKYERYWKEMLDALERFLAANRETKKEKRK